jgi:hypothetical protein
MKMSTLIAVLQALALAASASSQSVEVQLPVTAIMDIYRAGGYDDGSDGIGPAVYAFPARAGRALSFQTVTGLWNCNYAITPYGPDGVTSGSCNHPGGESVSNPIGPFSGYGETNFSGAMEGVFLEDTLPLLPPPGPLNFRISGGNSYGRGIATDFYTQSPRIGEIFFIGDGLTGTGTGKHQVFIVPPTATHLYIGNVDTCTDPAPTIPGCYSDNTGGFTATFVIFAVPN